MFTALNSYIPAVVETGLAHVSLLTRGSNQADAALARRMKR